MRLFGTLSHSRRVASGSRSGVSPPTLGLGGSVVVISIVGCRSGPGSLVMFSTLFRAWTPAPAAGEVSGGAPAAAVHGVDVGAVVFDVG